MTELERLRLDVDRAALVRGMQMSNGWKLLETEIQKILESIRREAVSPKTIGDSHAHAALVGAHNALQSLLDLLEGAKTNGQSAEKKVEIIEAQQKEERDLERSIRRI